MRDTVYLLGAGANQAVKDWDDLSPPMIRDLFRVALKKRKFSDEHYTKKIQIVYNYIERFWKSQQIFVTIIEALFGIET